MFQVPRLSLAFHCLLFVDEFKDATHERLDEDVPHEVDLFCRCHLLLDSGGGRLVLLRVVFFIIDQFLLVISKVKLDLLRTDDLFAVVF